jgi:hypothetical protein
MGFTTETPRGTGQEVTLTLARDDVTLLDRCLNLAGRGTASDGVTRFLIQHARDRLLEAVRAAEAMCGGASPVQPLPNGSWCRADESRPERGRPSERNLAPVSDDQSGSRDRHVVVT